MRVVETALEGVLVIEPRVFQDARGFFLETYHAQRYAAAGLDVTFVQDNHSRSRRNTLRGLHFQVSQPQGKLVRVIEGTIWDVAVDIRPDSPTFGQHVGVELSAENFRQIYVPPGFAHGFCVTTDVAQVEYKCTAYYDPADERGIAWNDPRLAIPWPVSDPVLSTRDQENPTLEAWLAGG
jgi:dTDP-4-dehydrorhamnose 3,5-epimerase